MGPAFDHAAPAAVRAPTEGTPARPLRRPPAAGARRRHHHRPHLAGQRDPARQPGGRLPGRARRRPRRPQCLRFAPRQLGGDGARGLPQQDAAQPLAPGAPVAHTVHVPSGDVAADLARPRSATATRATRRAGRRRTLRHRLVARLGRQGPAPARHPRRAGAQLRAHPPLEPDRHGHPAAAPAGRSAPPRCSWRRATGSRSTRRPRVWSRARGFPCACCAATARPTKCRPSPRWKPSSRSSCCAPVASFPHPAPLPARCLNGRNSGADGTRLLHPCPHRRTDPAAGLAGRQPPAGAEAGRPAARLALADQRGAATAAREGRPAARAQPRLLRRPAARRSRHQTLDVAGPGRRAGSDDLHFRIADDRLRGELPDEFTEALLRKTYGAHAARSTPCWHASPAKAGRRRSRATAGPSRRC